MIEYRIYQSVYDDIISGKKTIEFRLLNEKSANIKKDDLIKFVVLDNDLSVIVKVVNKYIYADINDMWKHKEQIENNILNYSTKEELEDAFIEIFGKDKLDNSEIVGIEFKLENIKNDNID